MKERSIKNIVNSFKDYPNIIKIKQTVNGYDVPDSGIFSFKTVNELKLKPSEKPEYKKGKWYDTIPRKLIQISADFFSLFFTKTTNTSITQNLFPDNAKTVSVVSLDKGKINKN